MISPALALTLFVLLAGATIALAWPRTGIVARLRRGSSAGLRVGMEDALKHLYKCSRERREATVESVAGSLEVSQATAARILQELRRTRLVHPDRITRLTDEGRDYALRIIRTHRLWERYLADRTGVAPGEWHELAEEQEHHLSPEAVEALDARLGRPRFDPHGDPIPTAAGDLPESSGVPLPHLSVGDRGVVTHLEDEPRVLFDLLVAQGISPGMKVEVLESPDDRIRFSVDGRGVTLDAAAAGNITVHQREEDSTLPGFEWDGLTLEDIGPDEAGVVVELSPACQGTQRRRLLDLGVVPGTIIEPVLTATTGDPTAYRIRGALIALRRDQQRWIRVRRAEEEAA